MTPAQRWFRLAEQDLAAAGVLLRDGSAALRIVGFLAQQAAEKALKSGLLAWIHRLGFGVRLMRAAWVAEAA